MDPFYLFNPQLLLDKQFLITGQLDPALLLDAAAKFPGGAIPLVFALFWAPFGPGIMVGVELARHTSMSPLLVFGLYALSDMLASIVCAPLYMVAERYGTRVPALRTIGRWLVKLSMFGARVPRAEEVRAHGSALAPALWRIGTIGFGMNVYAGGMVVTGLPIPQALGWASAIVGDLIWFAILLGTSIATSAVVNDDKVVGLVMMAVMIVLPYAGKRLFPAMRDPAPAAQVPAPTPAAAFVHGQPGLPAAAPAAPSRTGVSSNGPLRGAATVPGASLGAAAARRKRKARRR